MVAASASTRSIGQAPAASAPRDLRLRLLLASGGDDRIWLDPVTRRNRYGAPAAPAPDELWFSSSTASAPSPRGWAAAGEALATLGEGRGRSITAWFDSLRRRLLALYGAPGAEAVLAASGTEAELVALCLALSLTERPLVNVVVAPTETGSGVPAAASGQHFLGRASLGGVVAKGERLTGWEHRSVTLETVEIRGPNGALRLQADVDLEVAMRAERAVAGGSFALLHVLDASKTGRPGVSRAAAAQVLARYPGRTMVVVDACQLRCPPEAIRHDLAAGFAVMVTGSKFAGGPAFCGALLLPASLVDQIAAARPCGAPLAPYSAALDWPPRLRPALATGLAQPANLGLGLRWTAALAEIEAFEAVPSALRAALLAAFDRAVRDRIDADPGLTPIDGGAASAAAGLIPVFHVDGHDPRVVYEALGRGDDGWRSCHLGQPVLVGRRAALRVCASMPMIADAAERGFAAVEDALDELFRAWTAVRA